MRFGITHLPLIHRFNRHSNISFDMNGDNTLEFSDGIYYLDGENGSGKSTFLSILALTSGTVGMGYSRNDVFRGSPATIKFEDRHGEVYDMRLIDSLDAADIRERHFCIFPQRVYLFPGLSSWLNNKLLNGDRGTRAFSKDEYPDTLSAGRKQIRSIEILLNDPNRRVWFLDEAFSSLHRDSRSTTLKHIEVQFCGTRHKIAFIVDHSLSIAAEQDLKRNVYKPHKSIRTTIRVRDAIEGEFEIKVYKIRDKKEFFGQISQSYV